MFYLHLKKLLFTFTIVFYLQLSNIVYMQHSLHLTATIIYCLRTLTLFIINTYHSLPYSLHLIFATLGVVYFIDDDAMYLTFANIVCLPTYSVLTI